MGCECVNFKLVRLYEEENKQCQSMINAILDKFSIIDKSKLEEEIELINKFNDLIDIYEDIMRRNQVEIELINGKINSLDGLERLIMHLRYIENKTWENIADMLSISVVTAHRYHRKALEKIS